MNEFFFRCYARLRGHFFIINNGGEFIYASDLAKNFVRAFSVREFFTAAPGTKFDENDLASTKWLSA